MKKNNHIPRLALWYQILKPYAQWTYLRSALLMSVACNAYFYWVTKQLKAQQAVLASSGKEVGPLDLLSGFDADLVSELLGAYGATGRAWYLFTTLVVDMIYPLAYTAFFVLSAIYLLEKAYPRLVGSLYKLCFLPLAVLVLDWAENLCFAWFTWRYPVMDAGLVPWASFLNQAKWLALLPILMGLALGLIARLMNKNQSKA